MFATIDYSLDEIPIIASKLIEAGKDFSVWTFNGQMGAGKTTLIKALGKVLGCEDDISSPTYSIVNEYLAENSPIFHIDAFRINSPMEAIDAGLEDYIYSKEKCWVEWPEKIESLLPEHYFEINIEGSGAHRTLQYRKL